jgi:hypothetical protein
MLPASSQDSPIFHFKSRFSIKLWIRELEAHPGQIRRIGRKSPRRLARHLPHPEDGVREPLLKSRTVSRVRSGASLRIQFTTPTKWNRAAVFARSCQAREIRSVIQRSDPIGSRSFGSVIRGGRSLIGYWSRCDPIR